MSVRDACPACGATRFKKKGHTHNGKQHHHCSACPRQFVLCSAPYLIPDAKRDLIEHVLLERLSLRGICRAVGVGLTRKSHAHQRQDGPQKAFALAKRQVQEQSKRERGLDRDVGINRLDASLAAHRRGPGVDRVVTDPERDVAAIVQCLIIRAPVADAARGVPADVTGPPNRGAG